VAAEEVAGGSDTDMDTSSIDQVYEVLALLLQHQQQEEQTQKKQHGQVQDQDQDQDQDQVQDQQYEHGYQCPPTSDYDYDHALIAKDIESMVLHTLHTKTVDWTIAQMIKPMEAVVADPPSPPWRCISSGGRASSGSGSGSGSGSASGGAKLVVAGDFMTHSSYVGCYASADAAADVVISGAHLAL
jgi:hypothetical protein